MKKYILTAFLAVFIAASVAAQTPEVSKQTYLYSVKGTDSLRLDKYDFPSLSSAKKPCLIFMFGGGFMTGTRDNKAYDSYFQYFARQGYSVVSIDYRLGMKAFVQGKDKSLNRFAHDFVRSISMAVEDLYDATDFVLAHADKWGIDSSLVITSGSSAGAISVLHGEYGICNNDPLSRRLPAGFNYAGVISFAGAIFADGPLEWKKSPAPILFFHGTADGNVPYGAIGDSRGWFYGPEYIAGQLTGMKAPHYFYSVENATHRIAVSPMNDNRAEILIFLDKFVKQKQKLIIDTSADQLDLPARNKDFTIEDYVKNNFGS